MVTTSHDHYDDHDNITYKCIFNMTSLRFLNNCINFIRLNKVYQFTEISRKFSQTSQCKLKSISIISQGKCNFSSTSEFQIAPQLTNIHDTISSIQLKKRVIRKKKILEEDERKPGVYNIIAFATAEEYNLEQLFMGLKQQNLYETKQLKNNVDVIHAVPKYKVDKELREIFFFRDGSVVMWNITDLESSNILKFLRQFEEDSYSERLVQSECEIMNYKYHSIENKPSYIDKGGDIVLSPSEELTLQKYAFSNGMMLSVKLGIWESSLEKYINEMEFVTEDLRRGKINMTREQVLKKHGELFALRHYLNLSSDVLDTPDFYWDNESLESIYNQVCSYFCINKRTKVMNEKLNHCVALIELLSSHLSTKHSTKLEWTIIVLIMVEVFFETIHYIDRYVDRKESEQLTQLNYENGR